ncbi:PIN domain-containing protein [Patescibacteria group bacterium]|nr:PIN domain-containing protein [Patescibacteria group bacterium]
MNIFLDSSFLIAISINKDTHYKQAIKIVKKIKNPKIYSNNLVQYEAVNVICRKWGVKFSKKIDRFFKSYEIEKIKINNQIWQSAYKNLSKTYTKNGPNVFDYIHFACMKEYFISSVLTFDKHFQSFGFKISK